VGQVGPAGMHAAGAANNEGDKPGNVRIELFCHAIFFYFSV